MQYILWVVFYSVSMFTIQALTESPNLTQGI